MLLERVQRRASKFILNDYSIDYKSRLIKLNLLPLMYIYELTRLEPIMLKNLPIIPSRTSQKFYPLFLIYSQIITYCSFIILLILLGQ